MRLVGFVFLSNHITLLASFDGAPCAVFAGGLRYALRGVDMRVLVSLFAFSVVAVPDFALATDHGHDAGITVSPLDLIFPMVEVTGEYAASRRVGLAAVGGYGVVRTESTNPGSRCRRMRRPTAEP